MFRVKRERVIADLCGVGHFCPSSPQYEPIFRILRDLYRYFQLYEPISRILRDLYRYFELYEPISHILRDLYRYFSSHGGVY